jgi:hypothetical protein
MEKQRGITITNIDKQSNELYKLLCPVNLFRYFLRKQYDGVTITNEECDGLNEEFSKYLISLNLTQNQKENILPKNEMDVILNDKHPLRMHGFSPAYVYHFAEFVEKQKQEALANGA